MTRYFNITGPNRDPHHFGLDPLKRVNYPLIETSIARGRCFSLCSPRQSGKTTLLLALKKKLNGGGKYRCLYCNVEAAQAAGNDVERGVRLILNRIAQEAAFDFGDLWPRQNFVSILGEAGPDGALVTFFENWLYRDQPAKLPIVLFLDGVDLLRGRTLASVLRQLRTGQINSPRLFPQSVVLSSVRDVRDNDIDIGNGQFITGRSGSDVRESSIVLYNFTQSEIKELCGQYTAETGHAFQENVYSHLYILTGGRPWLVNALLCEALYEMGLAATPSRALTSGMIDVAKEHFLERQNSYMEQLEEKLSSPGVRETLFPILIGGTWEKRPTQGNLDYLKDLELIQKSSFGWNVTNALYRELIPKVMGMGLRDELAHLVDRARFLRPDGRLDFKEMIRFYQKLFCDNFLRWGRRYDLEGVLAQVLLHAFLRYILGNRGHMECDYALSTGRIDIGVTWSYSLENGEREDERVIFEIRLFDITKSHDTVVRTGVAQVVEYAKLKRPHDVYLLILDEDETKTWYDRLFQEEYVHDGIAVHVYGL
jgi:hypothetical protein